MTYSVVAKVYNRMKVQTGWVIVDDNGSMAMIPCEQAKSLYLSGQIKESCPFNGVHMTSKSYDTNMFKIYTDGTPVSDSLSLFVVNAINKVQNGNKSLMGYTVLKSTIEGIKTFKYRLSDMKLLSKSYIVLNGRMMSDGKVVPKVGQFPTVVYKVDSYNKNAQKNSNKAMTMEDWKKYCEFEKAGEDYNLIRWMGTDEKVVIPPFITVVSNAFKDCKSLKNIVIPDNVRCLNGVSFEGCKNLETVTIGKGVEKINYIDWGEDTFVDCVNLRSINVDKGNKYFASVDGVLFTKDMKTLLRYPLGKRGNYIIPDSVTTIGLSAFLGCKGLESVTIGKGVEYMDPRVGFIWRVFDRCESLKSINVDRRNLDFSSSDGVLFTKDMTTLLRHPLGKHGGYSIPDSVSHIANYAFLKCTGLTSVVIPNSVIKLGDRVFSGCNGLTSVVIPNSVIKLGAGAFSDCSGMTSVAIPDSITAIEISTFCDCIGLTSVTIPGSIKSIGKYAFENCTGLKSVTIEKGVTEIGDYAFHGCSGLTSVMIPNSITSIGVKAFEDYLNLKHIKSPRHCIDDSNNAINNATNCSYEAKDGVLLKWKTNTMEIVEIPKSITKIGNHAFWGHKEITKVIISNSVTSIGDSAFNNCTNLTSIEIPNSVTSIGNNVFSRCEKLRGISIPDSVTELKDGVFMNCKSLRSVTLPDSIKRIGKSTFEDCAGLTSVTIPHSVVEIDNRAFSGCTSLSHIEIPHGTTKIGRYAFSGCSGLKSVVLSDGVTEIYQMAFRNCKALTDISIPRSVEFIGFNAFEGCSNLRTVVIPAGTTEIGDLTFVNCSALTSINVDSDNPKYSSEDGVLFNKAKTRLIQCPQAKTGVYIIPGSVTEIGRLAFQGCTELSSITISDSVTRIYDSAFKCCTKLTDIVIPNSVTFIGSDAFADCTNLRHIHLPKEYTHRNNGRFTDDIGLKNVVVERY